MVRPTPHDGAPEESGVGPGAAPAGRYVVTGRLSVGALNDVLLARDRDGREVVLKRLHRHCAADPVLVAMFRHEARVLAVLDHPSLVRLLDAGRDDEGWYLALERVAGTDLTALQRAVPDLPRAVGVEVVRQLLGALEHIHTRAGAGLGIIHRDVAPGNVLLTPAGEVKLGDFGLATSVWRADPDRGQMKGTRGYMAPEIVTGEREADARSDLYAAGVILYELTVGRRLYEGSATQVMVAVADGPVASPAAVDPAYPAALDAVVRRALARSPEDRFPSAAAMRGALCEALPAAALAPARDRLAALVRGITGDGRRPPAP